jgi:hypothetical protein
VGRKMRHMWGRKWVLWGNIPASKFLALESQDTLQIACNLVQRVIKVVKSRGTILIKLPRLLDPLITRDIT